MALGSRSNNQVDSLSTNISIPQQQDHRRRQSILLLSESVASRRSSKFSRDALKLGVDVQSPRQASSIESRVLIDAGSPNFRTRKRSQHDEIINSLRANYLNDYMSSRKTDADSSPSETLARTDDFPLVDGLDIQDSPGIPERDHNLESQGGHITRELYRLTSASHGLKKTHSADDLDVTKQVSRPESTASALNVPGGFRREFIVKKHKNGKDLNTSAGSESGTCWSDDSESQRTDPNNLDKVPFLTRNFLEFLYVYGHFAGESFEEDFYPEQRAGSEEVDERSPLLAKKGAKTTGKVFVPKSAKGTTSTIKAFLLMIKSFIGTGVLFLPAAFSNGGLFFSIVMLTFFGLYSYWCYYILIQSKVATKVSSFGDIGQALYGPWMKFVILLSLVLTQLGFSGAYVIFTAKNLLAFINNVFHWSEVNIFHLLVVQLIIFIPLSFIRNISKLSLPSLLANFFVMGGILIVIALTGKHLLIDLNCQPADGITMIFDPSRWTLFVGTAIFAFEGIGLIIPVQSSMKHPEKFPLVLGLVITTATVLFVSVATLGYLSYGKDVQTVILLNLPQESILVNLIQFFYCLAILLSTPLQLFPAIAIVESKVFPKFTKIYVKRNDQTDVQYKPNSGKLDWRVKWLKNSVRSLIVTATVMAAYFGADNLDQFVSIVGSFACIPLVYVYPPLLHLRSCSKPDCHEAKHFWQRWPVYLDYALIVFGMVSMIYTSYQSLMS
ncbi:LAME_0H12772g1_1 [Lachancea meyersii CBS 8951]|uniref:LAME_0H12772g1_1 n=1 Tax=Lachancea meyersii CBS 8951 TaxID=1266667 RepID=A0A1G4KGM9_9SACH|nr:LAME_0H12772g1_1 [Lachancea meyersii CBS 8951]